MYIWLYLYLLITSLIKTVGVILYTVLGITDNLEKICIVLKIILVYHNECCIIHHYDKLIVSVIREALFVYMNYEGFHCFNGHYTLLKYYMVKMYLNMINYRKYVMFCWVVFVQYPITREIVQLRVDLKTKLNRVIYAHAINAA